MSPSFQGKRVLIFQQRGWGMRVGHFLAKKLQTEGAALAAVVFKNSALRFHTRQTEVKYQFLISHDQIMENPKAYLGNDRYTLAEICDDLGIDSIWPYVQSLRHHVRSYADKYYYGYKQQETDEEPGADGNDKAEQSRHQRRVEMRPQVARLLAERPVIELRGHQ